MKTISQACYSNRHGNRCLGCACGCHEESSIAAAKTDSTTMSFRWVGKDFATGGERYACRDCGVEINDQELRELHMSWHEDLLALLKDLWSNAPKFNQPFLRSVVSDPSTGDKGSY